MLNLPQVPQGSVAVVQPPKTVRQKGSASSRRQYQKRKAAGQCTYFGCSAPSDPNRQYCRKHLTAMRKRQKKIVEARKKNGLCTYCGSRPQFWGRRCIICRQARTNNPLPSEARRALKLYRKAEKDFELELIQVRVRFEIRKLLASEQITGDYARALRLYAGIDTAGFRTYGKVGKAMRLTKERVRQLLKPSKILIANTLSCPVPWKAVTRTAADLFPPRAFKRRSKRDASQSGTPRSTKNHTPNDE